MEKMSVLKMRYLQSFLICYLCLLATWISTIHSSSPSPVNCKTDGYNCIVSSTYGVWPDRSTCQTAKVVYPSTEEELISAVADAVKNKLNIKVVSKLAHSAPKLVCPRGGSGLLISTRDYANNIIVNTSSFTATVDSGVELREFVDTIAKFGLALPHSPYWDGLSIGGLLSTGAHGSSVWGKGSAVHEYVVGMRLIIPASPYEGFVRIVELTEEDEDLNAAKVSLGVLGVISQVTFALQPIFKRNLTYVSSSDEDLEERIVAFGSDNEFADVTWYASRSEAIFRVDNRVAVNTSGDGVNDYIGFQPTPRHLLESQRNIETQAELQKDSQIKCDMASTQIAAFLKVGMGLRNNPNAFTGYPVIGYQNLIQTSGGCQNAVDTNPLTLVCPWDHRFNGSFLLQTTVSIPISWIKHFIVDVKKLRDMDPTSLCEVDLYTGFLMRYVKKSSAYLGKTEDMVDIDFNYYRAYNASTARLHEDVYEEIEQMALFKYKGLPHWGKNRNVGFEGVARKYPNLHKFLEVKRRYDPQGLFSSEWTDAILSRTPCGVSIQKDNCALEGLCICSEDSHCAPDQGYFCRQGKVFRHARVCRYEPSSI
ncbi:hypothetical protein O6H91_01G095400 [Diphasiastrum complanatum]|uniref:Uncharacterized protein n=1 Tax=Diphasiastrum complanatum TaxID=34168 RepID=A0ACC2ETX6_DIPCM|nr:hypothetical protein O6H91_01G095400 [Diphasiastrum complanatum]